MTEQPTLEAVLEAVDAAMRAESERLARTGTARGVEQGIGVGHAMTPVRNAVRAVFEPGWIDLGATGEGYHLPG
jgi:hypothetical protein